MNKQNSFLSTGFNRCASVASALALLSPEISRAATPQNYYDAQGRLVTSTAANHAVMNYYLDAAGNRTSNISQVFSSAGFANLLSPGEVLFEGEYVISSDGRFIFTLQYDGNLVVYELTGPALWNSATGGTSAVFVVMQGDGNLVLYGPNMSSIWSSGTSGYPGAGAYMQSDGNFVIYDGPPIWATNTCCH